jgi:hypothetical protein
VALVAHLLGVLGRDEATFRAMLQRVARHANEFDPMKDDCEAVEQVDS